MNRDDSLRNRERCSVPPWRTMLVAIGLLAAGIFIGSTATRPSTAWAEVINAAPDQHFYSGGQVSVPILQDIAATLHQMDARLARLETAAQQMQSKRTPPAKP